MHAHAVGNQQNEEKGAGFPEMRDLNYVVGWLVGLRFGKWQKWENHARRNLDRISFFQIKKSRVLTKQRWQVSSFGHRVVRAYAGSRTGKKDEQLNCLSFSRSLSLSDVTERKQQTFFPRS